MRITTWITCLILLMISQVNAAEFVVVGDAGNSADNTGYGAVSYVYSIATYEVTNEQYAEFLNAVGVTSSNNYKNLYNNGMTTRGIVWDGSSYVASSGWENKPVSYVNWYDTLRFANWINNGAESGSDTETGVYHLTGLTSVDTTYYNGALRNYEATYWLPSENEWYKAAYYKGGGINAGYWDYPTQSDSISTADANYSTSVGTTTIVGSYDSDTYYGTYDQAGNVWEWNESIIGNFRGLRGGSFNGGATNIIASNDSVAYEYGSSYATEESYLIGFRIAGSIADASPIPEPITIGLLTTGLIGIKLSRMKRG